MNSQIKSALDAAGTAADYSARATYQRGYDAGVASVEAREWALGVQVVAQQERLKLADDVVEMARIALKTVDGANEILFDALDAWDAVPGDVVAKATVVDVLPNGDGTSSPYVVNDDTLRTGEPRLHWVYRQEPAIVLGSSKKPGKSRASPDRDTRPTVTIEVMPVEHIDPQAEALAQAEAREWALGVQVVAQAERLRLADTLAASVRCFLYGCYDQMTTSPPTINAALDAWDAVPGMEP